jgi:ankyrin repeat protein
VSDAFDPEVLDFAHQMFDLARSGDMAQLGAYIDAGLPINLTNDKGDTLLMLATYHDHPEAVAELIARGADATRINDRGQTALAAAVFRQSPESVGLLLSAGADPLSGAPSAVEMASFFNLPEMAALLQHRDD